MKSDAIDRGLFNSNFFRITGIIALKKLIFVLWRIYVSYNFAGLPITIAIGGIDFVTTAPAPIIAPSPIAIPGKIVAPAPIDAPLLTDVARGASWYFLDLGNLSLVKVTLGPTKHHLRYEHHPRDRRLI